MCTWFYLVLIAFFFFKLNYTLMPQCHIFLDFFSNLNSKHITSKQDKADKSVISIELVKPEEDKSSCPFQMDKRFLGPICHSSFCSQTRIILILITTLLARIHTPYLTVPPPSQACRYFRNVVGHSFYQGLTPSRWPRTY